MKIISPHLVCQSVALVQPGLSLLSPSERASFVLLAWVSSSLTDTEVEIINFEIFKTILLLAEVAKHQFVYFERFMQLSSYKDGIESFVDKYFSSSSK